MEASILKWMETMESTTSSPLHRRHGALRLRSPALVLFLLSPIIGELLSGSSPPLQFFQPVSLAILLGLYGSGAVIIRELALRWGKGWPTILVLGFAYGIVEEGLLVKSFFSPYWMDLGILGSYGRWFGVNWVWAEGLTIYHAVFSISIPILLTSLMFRSKQRQSWVGGRVLTLLTLVVLLETVIGLVFFPYTPPIPQYLLTVLLVIVLLWVARNLQIPMKSPVNGSVSPVWKFALLGALGTLVFFVIFYAVPYTGIPAPLTMLLILGWTGPVAFILLRMSGNGRLWSDRHKLASASGALAFFIVLAPIHELNPGPESMTGMTAVAIGFVVFLAWLSVRVRRLDSVSPQVLHLLRCFCNSGRCVLS
jgi:hypothetical protein